MDPRLRGDDDRVSEFVSSPPRRRGPPSSKAPAKLALFRRCPDDTAVTYILASARHGALYIGVTTDLPRRIWEHREGLIPGHTARYGIKRLVHLEPYGRIEDAIAREKAMKKWRRLWKIDLIGRTNPDWADLCEPGL